EPACYRGEQSPRARTERGRLRRSLDDDRFPCRLGSVGPLTVLLHPSRRACFAMKALAHALVHLVPRLQRDHANVLERRLRARHLDRRVRRGAGRRQMMRNAAEPSGPRPLRELFRPGAKIAERVARRIATPRDHLTPLLLEQEDRGRQLGVLLLGRRGRVGRRHEPGGALRSITQRLPCSGGWAGRGLFPEFCGLAAAMSQAPRSECYAMGDGRDPMKKNLTKKQIWAARGIALAADALQVVFFP